MRRFVRRSLHHVKVAFRRPSLRSVSYLSQKRHVVKRLLLAACVVATLCAGGAQADEPQKPAVKRRTVLHFGEDDIRGDITRPDGELVQAPRKAAQPSMVRVRKSFVDRALAGAARGQ